MEWLSYIDQKNLERGNFDMINPLEAKNSACLVRCCEFVKCHTPQFKTVYCIKMLKDQSN